ncbi:MAG: hypothetical protein MSH36_04810, partial [Prevotella sp.]|nr:hypothetical protein [Prevotella sp.]
RSLVRLRNISLYQNSDRRMAGMEEKTEATAAKAKTETTGGGNPLLRKIEEIMIRGVKRR